MPQFITIHRAPGLKRDELAQNAPHVLGAKIATFKQIYANIASGLHRLGVRGRLQGKA